MSKAGSPPPEPPPPPHTVPRLPPGGPDVVLDFMVEHDVLLVCLRNVGAGCAHRVRVSFEQEFHGLGGALRVPGLALFERLRFLGPGRELRALVDVLSSYFGRSEPEVVDVVVTYSDDAGRQYRRRLSHDLGVFRDLPRRDEGGSAPQRQERPA